MCNANDTSCRVKQLFCLLSGDSSSCCDCSAVFSFSCVFSRQGFAAVVCPVSDFVSVVVSGAVAVAAHLSPFVAVFPGLAEQALSRVCFAIKSS